MFSCIEAFCDILSVVGFFYKDGFFIMMVSVVSFCEGIVGKCMICVYAEPYQY